MMILTHKGIVAYGLEPTPIKWAGDGYREEQKKDGFRAPRYHAVFGAWNKKHQDLRVSED